MSLWLRGRRQKSGKRSIYSVSLPWLLIIMAIGILMGMLIPLIQFLLSFVK